MAIQTSQTVGPAFRSLRLIASSKSRDSGRIDNAKRVIGNRYALGIGAGSLAILAALNNDETRSVLDTRRTATSPLWFDATAALGTYPCHA